MTGMLEDRGSLRIGELNHVDKLMHTHGAANYNATGIS